ncbi:MAG: hypothetical protein HY209_01825 [Candidatus Omnitrophica bacterium]|nr:hypothetical protein [Candidatus Omnitrophota bacterium]
MSIIHDALKKVQQTMTTAQIKPEDIVEVLPSSTSTPDKKPAGGIPSWLIVSAGLLVLGAASVFIFSQTAPVPQIPAAKTSRPSAVKPLARRTISPKTATSTTSAGPASSPAPIASGETNPPLPVLNIQGIMASGSHHVALIDNNIYEEGSLVNGVKILKIDLNAITIEHDGKQETVAVRK